MVKRHGESETPLTAGLTESVLAVGGVVLLST
jgi:hypothetical protein